MLASLVFQLTEISGVAATSARRGESPAAASVLLASFCAQNEFEQFRTFTWQVKHRWFDSSRRQNLGLDRK